MRNATFTGNKAVASTRRPVSGWGGAIYNGASAVGDTPDLSVRDTTIDGGSVPANAVLGGAIASTSNPLSVVGGAPAKLDLTETTVTSNVAARSPAASTPAVRRRSPAARSTTTPPPTPPSAYGGGLYAAPSPATAPGFDPDARQRRRHRQRRGRARRRRRGAQRGGRSGDQRLDHQRQHLGDQRRWHLQRRRPERHATQTSPATTPRSRAAASTTAPRSRPTPPSSR